MGSVQFAATERCPRLLEFIIKNKLGPPALRAAVHRWLRQFGALRIRSTTAEIGKLQSTRAGLGTQRSEERSRAVGEQPQAARDPDKFDGTVDAQREFRQRGIPTELATRSSRRLPAAGLLRTPGEEPASSASSTRTPPRCASRPERRRHHFPVEGDTDTSTDGFPDNSAPYLSPTVSTALP